VLLLLLLPCAEFAAADTAVAAAAHRCNLPATPTVLLVLLLLLLLLLWQLILLLRCTFPATPLVEVLLLLHLVTCTACQPHQWCCQTLHTQQALAVAAAAGGRWASGGWQWSLRDHPNC
jgi:hypothetical protein